MRVRITLLSLGRRALLPINYNYFLTGLIYKFVNNSSQDYSCFLHDIGYKLGDSKKGFKLFTYSMLKGERVTVRGDELSFGEGKVRWEISSPINDFLQHLVSGVFAEGQEIKVGERGKEGAFLIERVETMQRPQFKDRMKFLCLSPITVSKTVGIATLEKGGGGGFEKIVGEVPRHCHYIRPWEDDFSEAIRKNLAKKYRLVTGKDIEASDFEIKIDTDYMNKKAGRIIKKINFKGTDIIGFMAPFEAIGSPELIEVGYEAGFGEKGSMGFGMVKEVI